MNADYRNRTYSAKTHFAKDIDAICVMQVVIAYALHKGLAFSIMVCTLYATASAIMSAAALRVHERWKSLWKQLHHAS